MWFEDLMGFAERSPEQVRARIDVDGEYLVSKANGRRIRCGRLSMPSLGELRQRMAVTDAAHRLEPPSEVEEVVGDVRSLHLDPHNAGAWFQAASQFNLLEMAGPSVTPERGVGIYEEDHTQGPACAIVCGGGTIFRNYFVPVDGRIGQDRERQLDALADLGRALGQPGLWHMQNGYAMASADGLRRIHDHLATQTEAGLDALRDLLRIGIQHDVEVVGTAHTVTQVYGAAMPVAYGRHPVPLWEPIARLVLEASYEATLRAARIEGHTRIFLTRLGGGVFGNTANWIDDAILRALRLVRGVDVRLVSHGHSNSDTRGVVARHRATCT